MFVWGGYWAVYFNPAYVTPMVLCSIAGGGSSSEDGEKNREDVLNIFSVASGHLYERFLRWDAHTHRETYTAGLEAPRASCLFLALILWDLLSLSLPPSRSLSFSPSLSSCSRIMMLSVLQHTKTPVKFWFLKNYLSPSFKVTASRLDSTQTFCLPALSW